jgi:hypothetical protein
MFPIRKNRFFFKGFLKGLKHKTNMGKAFLGWAIKIRTRETLNDFARTLFFLFQRKRRCQILRKLFCRARVVWYNFQRRYEDSSNKALAQETGGSIKLPPEEQAANIDNLRK